MSYCTQGFSLPINRKRIVMSETRKPSDIAQRKGSYEPEQPEMKSACLEDAISNVIAEHPNIDWEEVAHYMEQPYVDREHNRRLKDKILEHLPGVGSENLVLLNLIKKFRV